MLMRPAHNANSKDDPGGQNPGLGAFLYANTQPTSQTSPPAPPAPFSQIFHSTPQPVRLIITRYAAPRLYCIYALTESYSSTLTTRFAAYHGIAASA